MLAGYPGPARLDGFKTRSMKRGYSRDQLPRMRLFPPLHAVKVFFSSLNGRNAPVTITATDEQIDLIHRYSHRARPPSPDRVSYLQAGDPDGRRVVFVHGTPGNARGWADYLLGAPEGQSFIALDRPGYGSSEPELSMIEVCVKATRLLLTRKSTG